MKNLTLSLTLLICIISCKTEPEVVLTPLDLLEYGIPVTIMAPDSSEVKKSDFGPFMKDITVRKGEDYFIQIYASPASTTDVAQLKAQALAEVKGKKYFSKIINEEEAGFIYETKVDSNYIDYGFRYLKVQGNNEYIFQTGLIGPFTLKAVENMYQSVK